MLSNKPAIAFSSMTGIRRRTCMHVHLYGHAHIYAMINATRMPFQPHDAEATTATSRLLFNLINQHSLEDDQIATKLLHMVHERLRQEYEAFFIPGGYTFEEETLATIMLAIVEPHRARLAWAGDAQAFWLRDADFQDSSVPHIFSQGDANLRVVTSTLGAQQVHIDSRDWQLLPHDRIVLTRGVEFHQDAELTLSRMLGERQQEVALELINSETIQSPRWIGVIVHDVLQKSNITP